MGVAHRGAGRAAARTWRRVAAFVLAALACALDAGAARRTYYFDSLGSEQGLAQNTVGTLYQDHAGYVWIATQGGLHRYDGYGFRLYEHDPDRAGSLPDSFVTALAEDDAGQLWVGTNSSGVVRLDPATDSATPLPSPEGARKPSARANSIVALWFEAGRGLWVGTREGIDLVDIASGERRGVYRFEANGLPLRPLRRFVPSAEGSLYAPTSQGLVRIDRKTAQAQRLRAPELAATLSALVARDGTLYAGTREGLFKVAADGASVQKIWPQGPADVSNVFDIAEDATGRLWLAVRGAGVAIVDPATGRSEGVHHQRDLPGSLPEDLVTSLMVDRSGLLWLGTETRGAATTRTGDVMFTWLLDLDPPRDRVTKNVVSALHAGSADEIWMGTEGDGLKRYDRLHDRYEDWTEPLARALGVKAAPADLRVYAIVPSDEGRLWIGSRYGLFDLDTRTRQATVPPVDALADIAPVSTERETRVLERSRDGSLWIGTRTRGLIRYWPRERRSQVWRHDDADASSLPSNLVLALHEDDQGRLWAGTLDGLALIEKGGRLRVFRPDGKRPDSLSGSIVRAILQASDGTLWFGTHSGLNRLDALDESGARFTRLLAHDGLASSTVYGILEDRSGALWLSTNRGISRYDPATRAIRNFSPKDGLQAYEFNGGAAFARPDGELMFGGVNGMNLVRPEALAQERYVPPVAITALGIGSERHDLVGTTPQHWQVPQAARLVRFEFAALDFSSPDRNRYAWRLDGFDDDWVDGGNRREVAYTNLDSGNYTFRVRASNRDGVWNETGAWLAFRVVPPWWASTWMKLLYALTGALVIAAILGERRAKRVEEQRHQEEIREREDRLRLALWGSGDEFWDFDMRQGRLFRHGADQLLGTHAEESVSADDWRNVAVHPDDLPRVDRTLADHVAGVTDHFESEHRVVNAKGEWVWVLSRGKIVERDPEGQPLRICGTARDVTASRLAERERRIAAEVIRNMTEAVSVTDLDYHFTSVNLAFTRMTLWREDEVIGRNAALLNSPQHVPKVYEQMREALSTTGHWRGELWQKRKDGEEFLCWLELAEVRDAQGTRTHFVGVMSDITDRKRAEQELRYLANYDTLTGLPNRTLLGERLGHAIMRARRNGRRVAVLFLDLDRFKHVNDSMGHAAGDRMLKAAGTRLRHHVRDTDTVARLGGDEFTVVLEDIRDGGEAEQVAHKLLAAFAEPLALDQGQEVVISPSIGISLYPDHGQLPTDLLKFADTAMYQAKEAGRNTFKVYTSDMDAEARRRAMMVGALRKALERGEFRLVFQPKFSLVDTRIVGVEALLRWRSEELGEVPPNVFIPLAEEAGLIIEIGEFVIDRACATLARWREAGITGLTMAVNVSVLQLLRGELTRRLCEILADHDIAPDQIELELTESTIMDNAERSVRTLNELKAVGVSLAIDDFGTGYSSLSYLKRLPIDTLKIDKEFVGDITSDPDDEAITATIITMAHSLGLNVVAEGVETAEQIEYLREQGCDEIQGNWLSHPLSAERCLDFLRSRRGAPGVQGGPVLGNA